MKLRRMCGGGVRSSRWRDLRPTTSGSSAWALIHDRTGLALVLRDPAGDWPRRDPAVRRAARRAWVADQRDELAFRRARAVCWTIGHRPDPVESWCCLRCRCATGVG